MIRAAALLAAALALAPALCAAQPVTDAMDKGAGFFLAGKLDSTINLFALAVKENPKDDRARQILGNCLVIKGKYSLLGGRPDLALTALERASGLLPDNRDIRGLMLLAELERDVPTPGLEISTGTLDASAETGAVFDCMFGEGECAKSGRYAVHIVREGETMAEIAIKYYNDMTLWEKIWAANPHLSNPHRLEKGMRLLIPLDK